MEEIVLTTRERQQLLAVLSELHGKGPVEKRLHERRKVLLPIWIRPVVRGEKPGLIKATLMNVAARGVGLLLKQPLKKGHKFLISLRFREGGGWLVLCEVRNCSRNAAGAFKVGGRFVDRIDDPRGDAKPPLDWLL